MLILLRTNLNLLKEMHHRGQPADVVTYTSLLDALCKNQNLDKATALFMKMKERGIQPNKYTYTALIDGLCKSGRLKNAQELFQHLLGWKKIKLMKVVLLVIRVLGLGLCGWWQECIGLHLHKKL